MEIGLGSFIMVKGMNTNNNIVTWYAQVVGFSKNKKRAKALYFSTWDEIDLLPNQVHVKNEIILYGYYNWINLNCVLGTFNLLVLPRETPTPGEIFCRAQWGIEGYEPLNQSYAKLLEKGMPCYEFPIINPPKIQLKPFPARDDSVMIRVGLTFYARSLYIPGNTVITFTAVKYCPRVRRYEFQVDGWFSFTSTSIQMPNKTWMNFEQGYNEGLFVFELGYAREIVFPDETRHSKRLRETNARVDEFLGEDPVTPKKNEK